MGPQANMSKKRLKMIRNSSEIHILGCEAREDFNLHKKIVTRTADKS